MHQIESPLQISNIQSECKSRITERVIKKELGQFFTPIEIAEFMASFFKVNRNKKVINILDPGCGTLSLTSAAIEHIVLYAENVEVINITGFEIDLELEKVNNESIIYLKEWSKIRGVTININLEYTDYVTNPSNKKYDLIICNPPYFKIKKSDFRLKYFQNVLSGQQNIYGLFIAKACSDLTADGELIFIIPRSITSGIYFESVRKILLKNLEFKQIHVFESRKNTFSNENVLQENIIIHAKNNLGDHSEKINISKTTGTHGLDDLESKQHNKSDIIKPLGEMNIFYLPINSEEEIAMDIFQNWNFKLSDYKLRVSTGPIVAYRADSFFRDRKSKNSVPLLWLHNCHQFHIEWPLKFKGKAKWVIKNSISDSKTIKNKNYILIRRTASKDDTRLITAAPHYKTDLNYDEIGIENHLNYIHKIDGEIPCNIVLGLSAFYNSSLFESYYRTVCGSTQINATDLNNIPIPEIDLIRKLGNEISEMDKLKVETINQLIYSIIVNQNSTI